MKRRRGFNAARAVELVAKRITLAQMDLSEKYQLWGTFSIWDHIKPGAFLAEVIMYDRLVIPIPPDPAKARNSEERTFAAQLRARWEQPERMLQLLDVVRPVAEPIEWDYEHHTKWLDEFSKYMSGPQSASKLVAPFLQGWATGEVLLKDLPIMAKGAVAVAPFTDLDDLKDKLGITESDGLMQRQGASRGLPASTVSAVIGREFLVPSDPDRDEFYLLKQAVELGADEDYRLARQALNALTLQFIENARTDFDSVRAAVEAMQDQLATLDRLARRRRIGKFVRRAFFFTQVAADVATAPVNPVALGRAAINVGKFTTTELLGNPADPGQAGPAGALLHDSQRKLDLTLHGERRKDHRRWRSPRR
jgi:hypothetical protein